MFARLPCQCSFDHRSAAAVFFPGAIWAAYGVCKYLLPPTARASSHKALNKSDTVLLAAVVLLQPALILIDHGHFQYNCIALGLAVRPARVLSAAYVVPLRTRSAHVTPASQSKRVPPASLHAHAPPRRMRLAWCFVNLAAWLFSQACLV